MKRNLRPFRCELYPGAFVGYFHSFGPEIKEKAVFLNTASGRKIDPFDTHGDFMPCDDPPWILSRRSSYSTIDERQELTLPNRWQSHGIAGLWQRNVGSNDIYFFYYSKLVWTFHLPEGSYELSNWKTNLIYPKWTKATNGGELTLHGQVAGSDLPAWNFILPAEIPSSSERYAPGSHVRRFSHLVGKESVFVFSEGWVLVLDPQSGKIKWTHNLSGDPILQKRRFQIRAAEMVDGGQRLFLVSEGILLSFDLNSKSIERILRTDLADGPLPIFKDNALYCFTQRQ